MPRSSSRSEAQVLTEGALILQMSAVLPMPANLGRIRMYKDRRADRLTSLVGKRGALWYSAACLKKMFQHAGFSPVPERRPTFYPRRRFLY